MDVFGIDGVDIAADELLFDPTKFQRCDLRSAIELNRTFDVALCLEVAEHLEAEYACVLIQTLAKHSDTVFFSAACPGQDGQHHVNCQWPEYWQEIFNRQGFVCEDSLRWRIWANKGIEPWYRQNLFIARRDTVHAGTEPRIPAVIHPDFMPMREDAIQTRTARASHEEQIHQIEQGSMPINWYFGIAVSGLGAKLRRAMAFNR
jgi:hypothetical protein